MKLTISFLLVVFFAVYDVQGNSRISDPSVIDSVRNIALIFNSDMTQFCTGAIISPNWLLTSASCARLANYYDMRVVIKIDSTNNNPGANSHLIQKSIPHSGFNPITRVNDIGLINVNIADNDNSQKLKLQQVSENLIDLDCVVRGYGYTSIDSTPQNWDPEIRQKSLKTTNPKYCSNFGETVTNKICTFGGYVCKGDQGAPLIKKDGGVDIVIGVASANNGTVLCGSSGLAYSIFTQVYPYKSWIKSTTGISI